VPAAFLTGVVDALIERCASDTDAMAVARTEFDERRGRVFEDEEGWETRTAIFLEYYATERQDPELGESPALTAARSEEYEGREREALGAWSRSYRCLAEVLSLADGVVVIADAIGGAHIEVAERRGLPGVSTGDIAELRIVAFEDAIHFGSGILWHPAGTRDPLLGHVATMREAGVAREVICDFAASLKTRSLRYAHLEPSAVYEKAEPYSSSASR